MIIAAGGMGISRKCVGDVQSASVRVCCLVAALTAHGPLGAAASGPDALGTQNMPTLDGSVRTETPHEHVLH